MKRSFKQYCESGEAVAHTRTFLLARLPYDLLGQIVAYLDVEDLRTLMFCLLVEADIGDRILTLKRFIDVTTLTKGQCETLASLQRLLANRFAEIHLDCTVRHLDDIRDEASTSWIRLSGEKALKNANSKLETVRWMAQNVYYPLLEFLDTELCARCAKKLRTETYWRNTRPLHLCDDCHKHMERAIAGTEWQQPDGYAWLTATRLKALCWVPNHIKAVDFARENGIRLHSRHNCDLETAPAPDKEYFFLKDAMPHFRSLKK